MIDFEKRLESLKERRQGSRERAIFESMDFSSASLAAALGVDIREKEAFEKLKEPAGVKYTIGAMAPVDSKYTVISKQEGDRVADNLISKLESNGESVTKKLQGSVALNIHIRGYSDVDVLIIVTNPVNIELPKVDPSKYLPSSDSRSLLDIIKDVRNKSETLLSMGFPKAVVDCSGNKSIAISGGSLTRKVDIVPAIWFDTINYQKTGSEHDRGIKIYNKQDHQLLLNYPFLHIKEINEKNELYSGNLKCIIRLMKNLIADMPEYKKNVVKNLSSYDLAAIGYHMDQNLQIPTYMRLALVERLRTHLSLLLKYKEYRECLLVPDRSRKIFNTENKTAALEILHKEITDLAYSIFKELKPFQQTYEPDTIINKSVFDPSN